MNDSMRPAFIFYEWQPPNNKQQKSDDEKRESKTKKNQPKIRQKLN